MKSIIMLAAAASLASATSANTRDILVEDAARTRVVYGDLDIHSNAGREALTRRIHSAAERLCIENNVEPLASWIDQHHCYKMAVRNGLAEMDKLAL